MGKNTHMSFSLGYSTVIYILFYRRNHCFRPLSPLPPISLGDDLRGWWPGCWDLEKFQGLYQQTLHYIYQQIDFGILWASVKPTVLIHVLSHDTDIVRAISSLVKKIHILVVLWIFQNKNSFKRQFHKTKVQ